MYQVCLFRIPGQRNTITPGKISENRRCKHRGVSLIPNKEKRTKRINQQSEEIQLDKENEKSPVGAIELEYEKATINEVTKKKECQVATTKLFSEHVFLRYHLLAVCLFFGVGCD